MSATDLVVLGDSVMWGQGLLDGHKSAALVAQGLNAQFPGMQPVMLAHSGAVIGRAATCSTERFHGEMPESCPSILQQIDFYQGDPRSVRVVMVNGGINDIDIRNILSPFTLPSDLSSDIQQYCYTDMGYLLIEVKKRFSHPDTRIVVSSYFPILSPASRLDLIIPMVEFMGAPVPNLMSVGPLGAANPVVDVIVASCMRFWKESTAALAKCVSDVNIGTGPRCFFANVPFTEANSVFAPQAWLYGVGPAPDFAPQDEVAAQRRPLCDVVFQDQLFPREQCYRASAGHPNVTGAQQYAQAILSTIR